MMFTTELLLFLALGGVTFAPRAARANPDVFAGCLTSTPSTASAAPGSPQSATACAAACRTASASNRFSYFREYLSSGSTTPNSVVCVCAPDYTTGGFETSGNADACPLDTPPKFNPDNFNNVPTYYDARALGTSYDLTGCFSDAPTFSGVGLTPTGTDPKSCTQTCGESGATAAVYTEDDSGVSSCQCGSLASTSGSTTCGPDQYFVYERSTSQAIMSLARRAQLRERLERKRNEVVAHCPSGLTACNILGSTDAFECIDTRSELESCGGCMSGVFGSNNVTSTAVDCSSLPGVAWGASTCSDGICEAFACREGWALENGDCVRV